MNRKVTTVFIGVLCNNVLFALPPSVSSFAPISGPVGTTVTITGANFSTTASNNIVYFGAVKAVVASANIFGSQIQVTVPYGASFQPITVTVNQLTAYSFTPFVVTFAGGGSFISSSLTSPTNITGVYPRGFAIGDIDNDSSPDIVVPNNNATYNSMSIFRSLSTAGNIALAPKVDFTTGVNPNDISLGDLDGDGKLDIVVVNSTSNSISVFRNISTPGSILLTPKVDYDTPIFPDKISIADLNADGKPEIAVINSTTTGPDSLIVWRNTSTIGNISFAPRINFIPGVSPNSLSIGDIDLDSKPDIIIVSDLTVSVLRNTSVAGNISFSPKLDFSAGNLPFGLGIGDLNADGKLDIVVGCRISNQSRVSILRNTSTSGSISFASNINYVSSGNHPICISLGDLDGDSKLEIVAGNSSSSSFSVFRNTTTSGTISFAPQVAFATGTYDCYTRVGDLDKDGKLDISCTVGGTISKLSIYRNKVNEPNITSISPTTCGPGTTVTITGNNFTGATLIKFGGIQASSFSVMSSTQITAVVASGATGSVTVTNPYGTGSFNGFVFTPIQLCVKFFLSGYYSGGGTMIHALMNQGVGSSTTVADSIMIELRTPISPNVAITSIHTVLNTNGTACWVINSPITGNYYIVIKQKNGLETWSSIPVYISTIPVYYDFTASASAAFGSNQVQVESGTWAFYMGDLNSDGNIDLLDASILENDINNFYYGYGFSDLNGDGNIDLLDSPIMENNVGNFIFSNHP